MEDGGEGGRGWLRRVLEEFAVRDVSYWLYCLVVEEQGGFRWLLGEIVWRCRIEAGPFLYTDARLAKSPTGKGL